MSKNRKLYVAIILLAICCITAICYKPVLSRKISTANLCITEVCTHNESAAHDEYGDYGSDYIEIYNPTDKTINLHGYGLTDDSSKLGKFLFPEMEIEAGETIIAWSSEDKYPQEVWREDYVPRDVHGLGFSIADGEACILTDPQGEIISSAITPFYLEKSTTVSSSRSGLDVYDVSEPTPYFVEDTLKKDDKVATLEPPAFSINGGWFQNDVSLELSCQDGTVYYTLDGSDPDENSFQYDGPIVISNRSEEENHYLNLEDIARENAYAPEFNVDKATVVKAVAISESGQSSIVSNTYFVGLDEEEYSGVSIMSLVFSPDDLFGYENGIYRVGSVYQTFFDKIDEEKVHLNFPVANYGMKGRGWERNVAIEFLDEKHEKVLSQDAGLRIHGGFSVELNQKSFNLYARDEYGDGQFFNCDFYGNENSNNKLALRSGGGEDLYLAKMRDVFNQSLATDRAVGVQDAIPCVVFLNGEYWGLYNLQERACDNYVWNHYGVHEDEVVIVKEKYQEYVASNEDNAKFVDEFEALVDFVIENDMSIMDNYRKVESQIDIQSLIDCYALKIYTGCIDAYYNNEVMWRSKYLGNGDFEDGKWRFLANDLDNSANMSRGYESPEVDTFIEGNWISKAGPLVDEGLLSSLMANPEFKERFVTSFMDMMNNNFRYEDVSHKLWERAAVVRTQNVKSQSVFRGDFKVDFYPGEDEYEEPYDEYDFDLDIGLIDAFYRERPDYMKEYLKRDLGLSGQLYRICVVGEMAPDNGLVVNTSKITGFSSEWSGEYFSDYPVTLSIEGDLAMFSGWYVNGELASGDATYVIPAGFQGDELVVEIR